MAGSASGSGTPPPLDESSARLLRRVRDSDASAWGRLLIGCLPELRRWAHGRLSGPARSFVDTTDVVHDAILRTSGRLGEIEIRSRAALAAYLRKAVWNRIRDEHRRIVRHGVTEVLTDEHPDQSPTALHRMLEDEREAIYRRGLTRLTPQDRELVVAHIELEYTHEQLGCMTGRSPSAARMALKRALIRLAGHMRDG